MLRRRKNILSYSVALLAMVESGGAHARTTPADADGQEGAAVSEPRKKIEVRERRRQRQAPVQPAQKPQEVLRGSVREPDVSSGTSERLSGDIVVYGLKENVRSARNAKRNADQIVDVILSQDIGKLPDKNVPEALARVPGVQLNRERGEGSDIRIRGLGGVLTTVNGANNFSAGDRTSYLNDIQSDLVAGIEVFKTRTPDQIEGSNTGVVNLSLRRPSDFKNGATYAASLRGDYNDQVRRVNPYASAMVAYSADTDIGRFGFLVNGTYNNMEYNESFRTNGFPREPGDVRQIVGPTNTPGAIIIPERVELTYRRGERVRGGFNISSEWRPDDQLRFLVEGSFANLRQTWGDDAFWIPLTYSDSRNPPPTLTNIVMSDDGRLVRSLSAVGTDPIGPGKTNWKHRSTNYSGRFQVDYNTERFELTSWLNYAKATNNSNNIRHWIRFSQQPQFDVEFNTDKDPRGGMNIAFKNIDLMNPANYQNIDGFEQNTFWTNSFEKESRTDMKIFTFGKTVDYIKLGFRAANRFYNFRSSGRAIGGLRVPMAQVPGYELSPVGQGFQGTATASNANWLIGDGATIRNNWAAFRALALQLNPTQTQLRLAWPALNDFDAYDGNEGSYAAYGMFHYKVKLLFPIDSVIGARVVNSYTNLTANSLTTAPGLVDGRPGNVQTITRTNARGNYLDVLPSINAIVHLTDKLQLRGAWTRDVARPAAFDLRPSISYNLTNPSDLNASGGNRNLQAPTSFKYDTSLEYYFGKSGSVSLAAWYWEQDGFLFRRDQVETINEQRIRVNRPYNGGRARSQGIEAAATTFFTFLPGFLSSLGGSANVTYNDTRAEFPVFDAAGNVSFRNEPQLFVARYLYNLVGFYERGGLNARIAYNWQSRRNTNFDANNAFNNRYLDPVDRLDLSISYDLSKSLTLTLDAANLTRSGDQEYWGRRDLPLHIIYFSRNITAGVRARF